MIIHFTDHALMKIELLKTHGVKVSRELIEDTLRNPDIIDTGYKNRLIVQKRITDRHVLRVVYERKDEEITVITMYPGRRSRYEKD